MKALMTITDLAEHLQVSEITIRRWLADQKIPAIRVGKQWRFDPEQIEAWKGENTMITIEGMTKQLVIKQDQMREKLSLWLETWRAGTQGETGDKSLQNVELFSNVDEESGEIMRCFIQRGSCHLYRTVYNPERMDEYELRSIKPDIADINTMPVDILIEIVRKIPDAMAEYKGRLKEAGERYDELISRLPN